MKRTKSLKETEIRENQDASFANQIHKFIWKIQTPKGQYLISQVLGGSGYTVAIFVLVNVVYCSLHVENKET